MTSLAIPPALGNAASSILRVFGALPFHTDGDLLALAFGDADTLWSVEEPGVLRHWNVATRQQTQFHVLDDPSTLWAASPKAGLVAAGSDELQVWDVKSGAVVAGWPETSWVSALAFSPSGNLLVTGHDDGIIRLWDPTKEKFLREFVAHGQPVSAVAFSGDGKRLASAGEDKAIHLWDITSGKPVGTLLGHTDRIPALAWHSDGNRLLSAGWDTTVRVWDLTTCEPIILLNAHAGQVLTLALAPDGSLLASADSANNLHIWDLNTYRSLHVLRGHAREIRSMSWAADGRRLAAGGADRVIHLWDARQGSAAEHSLDPQASRTNLALRAQGEQLLSLGAGTSLRGWETISDRVVLKLRNAGPLRAFAASGDGRWIAGARALPGEPDCWHDLRGRQVEPPSEMLGLWNAETGQLVRFLEGPQPPVTALAFAPDSSRLATGGYLGTDVWVWAVPDGKPSLLIANAAGSCTIEALAWHPQGQVLAASGIDYMATGGNDGTTGLWNVDGREPIAWIKGGGLAVAYHPRGHQLAIASLVQTVRVWDVSGKEPTHAFELVGHLDAVTCLAYSADGRLLATGSDDHSVRLWDAETGLQRGQVDLDTQVKALAFAPDGLTLYTGNGNTSCYQISVRPLLSE